MEADRVECAEEGAGHHGEVEHRRAGAVRGEQVLALNEPCGERRMPQNTKRD